MGVAQKIVAVMEKVGYLKKDKQLEGGGRYMYLSEEKVTAELHAAFVECGLLVAPVGMELVENREDMTKAGNALHNTRIKARYRFIDPEDNSALDVEVFGEGSDSGDKTMNKCMTGAYKYALRQTFMISTGDDPDKEPSQESVKSTLTDKVHEKREEAEAATGLLCDRCGKEITSYTSKANKTYTAQQVADYAKRDYGRQLCKPCGFKERDERAQQESAEEQDYGQEGQ
jgi:hypothetical protein